MMQIFIDKEQARRYLELRKKNANITWDDIINNGFDVCECMATEQNGSVESIYLELRKKIASIIRDEECE